MKWIKQKPTEPGLYFVGRRKFKHLLARITREANGLFIIIFNEDGKARFGLLDEIYLENDVRWTGKIPEPEDG
jgi:hypothetical protein